MNVERTEVVVNLGIYVRYCIQDSMEYRTAVNYLKPTINCIH